MFAKHWQTSKEFTLAVAEAMPAGDYNFKPNDEEMSFGKVMAHIALANNRAFATVSGLTAPDTPAKIAAAYKDPKGVFDKEDTVQFLRDSFDFCTKALAAVTAEKFDGYDRRNERARTPVGLFHAYRAPSRTGRGLSAGQECQAARLPVLSGARGIARDQANPGKCVPHLLNLTNHPSGEEVTKLKTRRIGSLEVSLVGLGCNNFGWRIGADASAAVVNAALDAGINFFDTADIYGAGASEEFLGRALGRAPQRCLDRHQIRHENGRAAARRASRICAAGGGG